jgi:hypothetical protein
VKSTSNLIRYALRCDGKAQVARVIDGVVTFPQPWIPNGAIPMGAPGITNLSVWAVDKEMRFFANDQYLFNIRDPSPSNGKIGIFARSSEETVLSVNFSDFVLYSITQ